MNNEQKKKIESYIFYALLALPIVLFIFTPAFPSTNFDYALNNFMNKYLLGNGYYIATAYPFAAKVNNNFTVVFAVIAGVFVGIWRKDGVVTPVPKKIW